MSPDTGTPPISRPPYETIGPRFGNMWLHAQRQWQSGFHDVDDDESCDDEFDECPASEPAAVLEEAPAAAAAPVGQTEQKTTGSKMLAEMYAVATELLSSPTLETFQAQIPHRLVWFGDLFGLRGSTASTEHTPGTTAPEPPQKSTAAVLEDFASLTAPVEKLLGRIAGEDEQSMFAFAAETMHSAVGYVYAQPVESTTNPHRHIELLGKFRSHYSVFMFYLFLVSHSWKLGKFGANVGQYNSKDDWELTKPKADILDYILMQLRQEALEAYTVASMTIELCARPGQGVADSDEYEFTEEDAYFAAL